MSQYRVQVEGGGGTVCERPPVCPGGVQRPQAQPSAQQGPSTAGGQDSLGQTAVPPHQPATGCTAAEGMADAAG